MCHEVSHHILEYPCIQAIAKTNAPWVERPGMAPIATENSGNDVNGY